MSEARRRFLTILRDEGKIKANHNLAKKHAPPLVDLGALEYSRRGRTEYLIVDNEAILSTYIEKKYPNGLGFEGEGRLGGILASRDSKKGGRASKAVTLLRFITDASNSTLGFEADELTRLNGVVAMLCDQETIPLSGRIATVENFDVFLLVERFDADLDVVVFTRGRMDSRVIDWFASSSSITEIVHLGDYDPVGLAEFVRIETQVKVPVSLFLPDEIDLSTFRKYGKSSLVQDPKNRSILNGVREHESKSPEFHRALSLMLESGVGLEQEYLLDLLD